MGADVNTGGAIAIVGAGVAALIAGWWQTRTAKATAAPTATTAIGTEYQRLVTTLQGQVDRQGAEIRDLRHELDLCTDRHAVSDQRIAHLEQLVESLQGDGK